ncbi:hypothetical protein TRICI_004545 [Trichomonascus ciferrii]|uniref:Major facilitator superfamily (MFS) profile domain-containing protein n=1 Tax=Trichomonascus ciferrii TaxID=44093 RepID=A0A642V0Q2_9ASCO|nr:hypothetical protein TRICI_004545 [Trichomonascus ciferrii]
MNAGATVAEPTLTRTSEGHEKEQTWMDDADAVEQRQKKEYGVRKIEIMSTLFEKTPRVIFFFAIFLSAYTYNLDSNTRSVYQTQATSSYQSHSLLTTVNIVRSVIAAVAQPTFAKLTDVYGRMELLNVAIVFFVVGTIVESQAYDVQKFAGGAILYQIGYTGIVLVKFLLCADFSLMNWRLLSIFVPSFPTIINSWINGNVTESMGGKWSWGIGMWAIIVPVSFIPMYVVYYYKYYKGKKAGSFTELEHYQTDYQRLGFVGMLVDLFWKLDIIGIILFIAFMTLILVPLTLAGGVDSEWKTAKIIAPLVVGFCCIPPFLYWESVAEYAIFPLKLLKNRGVWAAMCIGTLINLCYNIQGDYMYTVLVVAVNESVASATRITTFWGFISVVVGTIFGILVVKFKRVKPFIVFGTCLWVVSMGMLIHYRGGESSHSGIVGAMVVLGIGTGFFTYPTQVSLQSCVNHQHMATVTSMYLAFYWIGSSVGSAISGAVWTQTLPKYLSDQLDDQSLVQSAYGDPMSFIVDYPWGSPERDAVVVAYRQTQRILLITATCMCVLLVASALFLRDRRLDNVQSLKHAEETDIVEQQIEKKPWYKRIFQVETA